MQNKDNVINLDNELMNKVEFEMNGEVRTRYSTIVGIMVKQRSEINITINDPIAIR